METKTDIPFKLRWLDAKEVGLLLGQEARYVLARLACRPDFPKPCRYGHPRWLASEVMDWQMQCRREQTSRRGRKRKLST